MLAAEKTRDPAGVHPGGAAKGRSAALFVCSPRPRVGKTMVARMVADFFQARDRPVVAFDANPNDPALSAYVSSVPATLAHTRGQMALFDRLIEADGTTKVIDVAADQFDRLLEVLRETGFGQEARERSIDTVVFYVADDHLRSLSGYRDLVQAFPVGTLVPVHNEPAEKSAGGEPSALAARGAAPMMLTHLPTYLQETVRKPGFSFTRHLDLSQPHQALHQWIARGFIALRDLELRQSLENFAPLFGLGAWAL